MRKSPLDVCLEKVAAGDKSYVSKLSTQLTDRLCYLPVLKVQKDSRVHRVEVVRLTRSEGQYVPIFTSEKRFEIWRAAQNGATFETIDVLGGDLCAVLGIECGVIIDLASECTVSLSPEIVQKIASHAASRAEKEFSGEGALTAPPTPRTAPAPARTVYEEADPHSTIQTNEKVPVLISSPTDTASVRAFPIETKADPSPPPPPTQGEAKPQESDKKGFFSFLKGKR